MGIETFYVLAGGVNRISILVQEIACGPWKKEDNKEEYGCKRARPGQLCSMNTNGEKRISSYSPGCRVQIRDKKLLAST